jgi:adenylosuccinate synthase
MKKSIDIVVGGQFGDEGKGQICAYLAALKPYGFAVRVGGSNAEHRFETLDGKRHTGRVLPVAGWVDKDVKMVLGAGHVIKIPSLWAEIRELEALHGRPQSDRIFIDSQAAVISLEHIADGKEAAQLRGSTHQGTGAAVAQKVKRDGNCKTARDYPALHGYIHDTVELMRDWMAGGETGLLEGSQGALLSLNHGYYPYCTSKDVTPAALLAEAGIPTGRVRDTWAVYRVVPMRVPGNSGPSDGAQLAWDELEALCGHKLPENVKRQTDSGDRERVFLWSWEEFNRSVNLIGPTHMALTFVDWWPTARMEDTLEEHIEKMEHAAGCPVSLVRNGPHWLDYYLGETCYPAEKTK